MKSYEEVLEKAKYMKEHYNIETQLAGWDIFELLEFKDLKELDLLKAQATEEEWNKNKGELTEEYVKKEVANYLSFAFGKAHNERGISANRSIYHFQNWLWVLEDYELLVFAQDDSNYGKDGGYGITILRKIRDKYKDFITKDKEEFIKEYGEY